MSKHRCKTCKGRDGCVHLNIFKLAQSENDLADGLGSLRLQEKSKKINTKTDIVDKDVNLQTKPTFGTRSKTKEINPLNPQNFHGKEVNVFKQSFNYPPTKEDREKNNRINKEESLFPDGKMISQTKKCEQCTSIKFVLRGRFKEFELFSE